MVSLLRTGESRVRVAPTKIASTARSYKEDCEITFESTFFELL